MTDSAYLSIAIPFGHAPARIGSGNAQLAMPILKPWRALSLPPLMWARRMSERNCNTLLYLNVVPSQGPYGPLPGEAYRRLCEGNQSQGAWPVLAQGISPA